MNKADKLIEIVHAEKFMISLIPVSRKNQLYIDGRSKLGKKISEYVKIVNSETAQNINENRNRVDKDLEERILHLEKLCDAAGIKHQLTKEDVYPSRHHGRD